MNRDSALSGGLPTLKPAIWAWPVAAAVLAAWPIWRSLFPEVPDLGEGWLRLQPVLGLASGLLLVAWAQSWRSKVSGFLFPSLGTGIAIGLMVSSLGASDPIVADVAALVLSWLALSTIFATVVLLKAEQAGIAAGCKPPRHLDLLPPLPRLGAIDMGLLLGALAAHLAIRPWNGAEIGAIIIGALSPGLMLAWSSLSDTARGVLAKRQVHVADASELLSLATRRRWRLRTPTVLLSDRVKLVSLYPADGIKPGELVGWAAAATMDEESDIGRAIQEFGVSHRIRLPALRQPKEGQPPVPRQALLSDGALVELRDIDDELDVSAHAEAIDLARAQNRIAMAVVALEPQKRVLGVITFAIAARSGAKETLRILKDRRIDLALTAPARDAADETALKSISIAHAVVEPAAHQETASVWRGGAIEAGAGDGLSIAFGGGQGKGVSSRMHIVVAREDARALVDLARFADDFRTRTRIVTLLAGAPGLVLIAAGLGYAPVTPFLITGVAIIGIVIATVTPQVLRASPALDNEGAED